MLYITRLTNDSNEASLTIANSVCKLKQWDNNPIFFFPNTYCSSKIYRSQKLIFIWEPASISGSLLLHLQALQNFVILIGRDFGVHTYEYS